MLKDELDKKNTLLKHELALAVKIYNESTGLRIKSISFEYVEGFTTADIIGIEVSLENI